MQENTLKEKLLLICEDIRLLEREIGGVLVGQRQVLRGTLIAMIAGGHVLLEGVPGLGKTLLVRTLAEAIEGHFSRIQFTPDLMPADLTGTNVMREIGSARQFEFLPGPIFANVVLADEINRATPKTQAALLEAMQERSVTVGGQTHHLDGLFFVLATQNPLEMEGTYPLPEAQLDRFFCKILVPFPQAKELTEILQRTTSANEYRVKAVLSASRLIEMGEWARRIPVADELVQGVVSMILASHPQQSDSPKMVKQYVRYGASPRGGQALLVGAKINALLDGRFNVAWNDIRHIAPMVLRHRIILNFEGQAERKTTDEIIAELLKRLDHV